MTAYTSTKNILPEGPNYAEGDTLTLANGSTWYYTECDGWQFSSAGGAGVFVSVTAPAIDVGASGTAGALDVFPTTASKGKLAITAGDSAGDTTTTLVNASQAGARTYTIPDAGGNASFVMTAGAQTIAGVKTFSSPIVAGVDTGVAAAGVTLTGTTLAADGTDAAIDINITPKGTGALVTTKVAASTSYTLGTETLILQGAGAPVDYTDGDPAATGEGAAGIGSLYIDTTAGKLYINSGTKAEPLWKIVTSA